MKNVAATSGHRVSFGNFLTEVAAREGNGAGRVMLLNFLSRPPRQASLFQCVPVPSEPAKRLLRKMQDTDIPLRCKRNLMLQQIFFVAARRKRASRKKNAPRARHRHPGAQHSIAGY